MKRFLGCFSILFVTSLTLALLSPSRFLSSSNLYTKPASSRSHNSSVFILNRSSGLLDNRLRILANDSADDFDDSVLFGEQERDGSGSFEDQGRSAEIDAQELYFTSNLEELRQKLETFRRYSPLEIPDEIKAAALNCYIDNAVIMQSLGILDQEAGDEEDGDYYFPALAWKKSARKTARSALLQRPRDRRRLAKSSVALFSKSNKGESLVTNDKRKLAGGQSAGNMQQVYGGGSSDRASGLDFGELDNENAETSGPFINPFRERRLRDSLSKRTSIFGRKSVKVRKVARPEYFSASRKIRQGDELLEMARQGSLFDIDMNSIYNIKAEDIGRFWSSAAKKGVKI